MIYALMARARIIVFPPIEDFGMVAVEAMAAGTPVMANARRRGRSVKDGIGGALFDPQLSAEIRDAADACASLTRQRIAAHARRSTRLCSIVSSRVAQSAHRFRRF